MSPWFNRDWTALELAKSRKVKVLFKSNSYGHVVKDRDEDILAKPGEPSSACHLPTTQSIRKLRNTGITKVNDILTSLGPHDASKPKDMAIISGLLAGVEIPVPSLQQEIF